MDELNAVNIEAPQSQPSAVKPLGKALTIVGVGIAVSFVVITILQLGIMELVQRFIPQMLDAEWFLLGVNFITIAIGLLGIFTLFLRFLPTTFVVNKTNVGPFSLLKMFLALYPAAILLSAISNFIMLFVSAIFSKNITNPIADVVSSMNPLYTLLFIVILSPILEEVVFRGILLSKLRPYGNGVAIFTSGVLFGLFHGNLFQMFYAVLLGMFFAALVMKTGKLRHAIILHIIFNFCGSILPTLMLNEDYLIVSVIAIFLMVALFVGSIVTLALTIAKKDFVITKNDLIRPSELKIFFTNPAIITFIIIIAANTFASFIV